MAAKLQEISVTQRAYHALVEAETLRIKHEADMERERLERRNDVLRQAVKRVIGIDVEPQDGTVTIDRIPFTVSRNGNLVIMGTCPRCQSKTISIYLHTMAGIGAVLREFTPIYEHECSQAEDVIVKSSHAPNILSENRKIDLVYWPDESCFRVGQAGVEQIIPYHEEGGMLWLEIYRKGQITSRVNASTLSVIHYREE